MSVELMSPSYSADAGLLEELHTSIQEYAGDLPYTVIVPDRDTKVFEEMLAKREQSTTLGVSDFVPKAFWNTTSLASLPSLSRLGPIGAVTGRVRSIQAIAPARFPLVRGWIMQQLMKVSYSAKSTADSVLMIDSDVSLIRELDTAWFTQPSTPTFVSDSTIDMSMKRHRQWHSQARRILGLPSDDRPVYNNYISALLCWSPELVRSMIAHIERVHRVEWWRPVLSSPYFSEAILYGVYVEEVLGGRLKGLRIVSSSRVLSHWQPTPLTDETADELLDGLSIEHLAIQLQSTSNTSRDVRTRTIDEARRRLSSGRTLEG